MMLQIFQILRGNRRVSGIFFKQKFSFFVGQNWAVFDGLFVKTCENKVLADMLDGQKAFQE
jgi:hypothetical protein